MVKDNYQLDNKTEVTIGNYTYIVNSYFLTQGSRDVGKIMEAIIQKKVIRTIESSKQ